MNTQELKELITLLDEVLGKGENKKLSVTPAETISNSSADGSLQVYTVATTHYLVSWKSKVYLFTQEQDKDFCTSVAIDLIVRDKKFIEAPPSVVELLQETIGAPARRMAYLDKGDVERIAKSERFASLRNTPVTLSDLIEKQEEGAFSIYGTKDYIVTVWEGRAYVHSRKSPRVSREEANAFLYCYCSVKAVRLTPLTPEELDALQELKGPLTLKYYWDKAFVSKVKENIKTESRQGLH